MSTKIFCMATLMLCISALFNFGYSTTYYVSPSGTSSAAGTISAPLSFTTAIGKSLTAGDSIIVRGGTYSFTASQSITKSGSSSEYLTIVAYSGETPILDFRNQAYSSSNPGLKLSGNYVYLKGIIIQGAGDNGMIVTGSNNRIEHCVFRWNCDSGLQMKTGSDNYIVNCDSYENFDYESVSGSTPDYGGNADGFADKQYTNTGTNTYFGCRSWNNSDDGWDSYEKIGNTVYDSCWCFTNAPASYDMTDHIRFATDSASWFYQFKNSAGRYVITNYGNGNGFKVGGNYTANNATLKFCVSVMNPVKGFDQNNNNGIMTLYNCTGYANNPDYGFSNGSYGTLYVYNCASLGTLSTNKLATLSVTQSNNSWLTGFSCSSSDFKSLDYTELTGSRQSDGSLPEIDFLHQQSTSSMIDKGKNVGLSYYGSAPDLGAFEYIPTSGINETSNSSNTNIFYSSSLKEISVASDESISNIYVYDISGRLIYGSTPNTENINLNASGWQTGTYFVKVINNKKAVQTNKIFVY